MKQIKLLLNINLLFLFIAFHISVSSLFLESQAVFYIATITMLLLTSFYIKELKLRSKADLFVMFLFLFILSHLIIRGNEYGGYWIYTILLCWILFFVLKKIFYNDGYFLTYTFWLIVLGVYIEILLGFAQLLGLLENNNNFFVLGGSLGNPGAYAGYLCVIFPFLLPFLFVYKSRKTGNAYYVLLMCLVFSFYLITVSFSRGAWIACFMSSFYVLNNHYEFRKNISLRINKYLYKIPIILSAIFLLSIVIYVLYSIKIDSIYGRLLIWKISIITQHCNLLFGEGFGFFAANYGHWQIDYFASEVGSEYERYLADYVTCAYNEFLQILIEQGLVGLTLWVIVFFLAFKRKNVYHSPFVVGSKASLIAMLVLSCVSYPFSISLIYLHCIVCLAIIFHLPQKSDFKMVYSRRIYEKIVYSILSLSIVILGFYNLQALYWVREGQKAVFSNRISEGLSLYNKSYPRVKNNGLFYLVMHLHYHYWRSMKPL